MRRLDYSSIAKPSSSTSFLGAHDCRKKPPRRGKPSAEEEAARQPGGEALGVDTD